MGLRAVVSRVGELRDRARRVVAVGHGRRSHADEARGLLRVVREVRLRAGLLRWVLLGRLAVLGGIASLWGIAWSTGGHAAGASSCSCLLHRLCRGGGGGGLLLLVVAD